MTARRIRRLVALALSCALLGGLFLYLMNQDTPREQEVSLHFSQREPQQIDRLEVQNAQGGFTVTYQQNPDGYVVDDVPPELLDMERFIALMVSQAALTAKTRVAQPLKPLQDYGLDAPQARAELTFTDGGALRYSLGAKEPLSGDYYLQLDGDDSVYTYPAEAAEALLQGRAGLISTLVTPELAVSSPLSAIRDARFSGPSLDEPIHIIAVMGGDAQTRAKALTFGAATHLVEGRGLHELDQMNGIRVLGSLLGIRAIRVLGYNLAQEELRAYTLDKPAMTAEFTLAGRESDGQPIALTLADAGNDTFYAHVSGRDAVYLVNRPAFYDARYEDLIMRYFAAPMLVDISGLTIKGGGSRYDITFSRDGAQPAKAAVNGHPVDTELFYAFYRLVTSAAADGGLIAPPEAPGEPVLEIAYHYKSDGRADDLLRFYPGTVRRLMVEVNGVAELDIRESFMRRLLEACENLMAGLPIEEVW